MTRLALWLLPLVLLASGALAFDDYVYDEEAEEEVASSHVPVFSSRARQFDVKVGDDVTLPCLVDHLGATILVWEGSQLNGDKVFYVGTMKQEKDPRFTLQDLASKGNSMVISGVRADDAGTYTCKVDNNVALTHTVNVQYAPTVDIIPKNGVLVVNRSSPATLQCMADGNPKPTVTWTREGGLLPNGNKKLEGMKLVIPSVESSHMGTYTCTVNNGIGETIVKNFRLEVIHAPEIEVATKKVHSGAGYEAQLICNVHGEPMPEVSWRRVGDAPMDVVRHRESREGAEYSLNIDEVHDSDLGQYTCRARNIHGTAAAIVELTGQPKEVMITSEPHGQGKDSYTLRWNVESYAPIEEYKVIYKKAQMESGGAKEQEKWEQITVPAPPKDGSTVIYAHMHVLHKLAPDTAYEAVVTAKNKYGWSDEPEPFKLYTFKARDSAADLIGGEALGSTDPNTAGSVRSGALAVAAALGALLAVL